MEKVDHLSNIMDGRTPLRHATSAKLPSPTSMPTLPTQSLPGPTGKWTTYLKPSSRGGNSGGPSGLPQGEDNDSSQPSPDIPGGSAPSNLNPITTHKDGGETCAVMDA